MLPIGHTDSNVDASYIPLHKKFRHEPLAKQTFCERQEFSIKFACMVVFAISLILCGALASEIINDNRNAKYD